MPHALPFRLLTLLAFAAMFLAGEAYAADEPGLVKAQPASGRFVKTDRGFMVPYEAKIPGTEVTFAMEPIPGGVLKLGSPANEAKRNADEGQQVDVTIEPFWMGRYEVTWAEYKNYMALDRVFREFVRQKIRQPTPETRAYLISAPSLLYDPQTSFMNGDRPKLPAATMTQFAARQYTKWLSGITGQFYCLPSEARWEYAARAGATTSWFFGADGKQLADFAWYFENSKDTTHDVGTKKPNPWGLYDMYGNVGEWTLDEFSQEGYTRQAALQQPLVSGDAVTWPTKLFPRVIRGGSYDAPADRCRSAARGASNDSEWNTRDPSIPRSPWWFTEYASLSVGFRLARPLNPPVAAERARYWDADFDKLRDDLRQYIELDGHGALGLADPQLPKAIQELKLKR